MRVGVGNESRIHRVERFELLDASSGVAGAPGQKAQNDSSGGDFGPGMKAAEQFKEQARHLTQDLRHRQLIQTALRKYEAVRDRTRAAFQDWQAARQAAA